MVNLKELINNLYNYRQLLKSNVQKDIRGKYKGSFLGILWSFVNPLLMTLVYAIVFPIIMKSTEPHYTTFLVIAILPWNYFTLSNYITFGNELISSLLFILLLIFINILSFKFVYGVKRK